MAIIYTYPVKATPANDDLILISDSADSNKTKQIKVSSLPGGASSGVTQIIAGTNVTIDPVSGVGSVTINSSGGGSLTVKDEGVDLTTSASSINFTGVGVTATTVGNDVTVDIPDAYVIEDVQLASAVSKGTALYISGPAHGSGRPTVDIADATDNTKMPVVGLALANYSAGEGKMIVTGVLDDVNTSNTNIPGGTLGNVIYVDNSGVDNNLTGTKPTGTDLIQNVGIITKSGANGSIQVSCIGRINDLPNLSQNNIWLGNSNGVPSKVSNSLDNLVDVSYAATNDASMYIGNGAPSGLSGTPTKTTAVGEGAGNGTTSGSSNTLIGTNAGITVTTGSTNTLVGADSGDTLTIGAGNVILGAGADSNANNVNAAIAVGKSTVVSTGAVAIGESASATGGGIALGRGATNTTANLALGSTSYPLLNTTDTGDVNGLATGQTPAKFIEVQIGNDKYYMALYAQA